MLNLTWLSLRSLVKLYNDVITFDVNVTTGGIDHGLYFFKATIAAAKAKG
ncbi:hypothetical protein [Halalkalibacter hemicellulosilyticus]|nr:hypothetical protein [Halalkalibacter hemicellulosilyticus]